MRNIICALLSFFVLAAPFSPAHAEMQTFTKEYAYRASEVDSEATARVVALAQAKKLLLEEIGTFVQSEFSDINVSGDKSTQQVREEIITMTAGVVSATEIEHKWDGYTYWLKAEIKVDAAEVAKNVEALRADHEKSRQLVEMREQLNDALSTIDKLRKNSKPDRDDLDDWKEKRRVNYERAVGNLSANEWTIAAFKNLLEGRYSEAIKAADKTIGLKSDLDVAYVIRGTAYYSSGDFQKSIESFDQALHINPKYVPAYNNRGLVFMNNGDFKRAVEDFDEAVKLDSNCATCVNNRGAGYAKLGDYKMALKDYEAAIKIDPRHALAYDNRGAAFMEIGEKAKALSAFSQSISIAPQRAEPYLGRALVYQNDNECQKGIPDLEKAIELNPRMEWPYFFLGNCLMTTGNVEKGAEYLKASAKRGFKRSQLLLKARKIQW